MNQTDDQLISQFMQANKHEIADNGFSRRVMHRLPMQAKVLSDILTTLGVLLSALLFFVFDGPIVLADSIYSFFQYQALNLPNINFQTMLPALAVLVYLGIQRACTVKE